MVPLRVAVLGCGRIARVYMQAFCNIGEDVRVVLAFDKVPERAQEFAQNFDGCMASWEVEPEKVAAVLKEQQVDLLHILLPHHLHCVYAVAALNAGIHVLTEKPIALSMEDARKMQEASIRNHRQLGVIFQNRYIEGVLEVRRLLQEGKLGKLKGVFSTLNWHRPPSYYRCDWKGKKATEGGGVVIDQAIHSIDLVRFVTGLEAVKIMGHTSRRVLDTIEVEDEADAAIILNDGTVYSFFACNYYATNSPIRVEFCCENATALLTYDTMTIQWNDGRLQTICPNPNLKVSGENYWGCFHEIQIRECYQALRENRNMPWSADDAAKTLEIVLGIYQSAESGCPVVL